MTTIWYTASFSCTVIKVKAFPIMIYLKSNATSLDTNMFKAKSESSHVIGFTTWMDLLQKYASSASVHNVCVEQKQSQNSTVFSEVSSVLQQ